MSDIKRKRWLALVGLSIIKILVLTKGVLKRVLRPAVWVANLLEGAIIKLLLPVARLSFVLRRRLAYLFKPVKSRSMFILTNRYMVYASVVVIVAVAGFSNLHLSVARAQMDAVGERSIMFALASNEAQQFYTDEAGLDWLPAATLEESDFALGEEVGVWYADMIPQERSEVYALGDLDGEAIAAGSGVVLAREEVTEYTIAEGDTLSSIASKFGISLNTLLWSNQLTVKSVIRPGKVLTILPTSGVAHKVTRGDTVLALAKKYGVEAEKIVAFNKLADSGDISIGQQLIIPGGQPLAQAPRPTAGSVKGIFTTAPSGSRGGEVTGGGMVWPAALHTVVRGKTWFHTGMDIDCNGHANGTSTNDNYAAQDGVVTYAGWRNGYGLTVEISHSSGLMTRYGHHYSLYVQKGTAVSAGDPIGRCGSTGNSSGTHLHFEVISNGAYLNPADYIR